MAVTYDKISYGEIEQGLKKIVNDEFRNVYISDKFKMLGTECIRINLDTSTLVDMTNIFEEREYSVMVRYYHQADTTQERVNESVKANIDRLRKHLLDNKTSSTNKWTELKVDTIEYNLQDSENDDNENLHITEFNLTINHYNQY